MAEDKGTPAPAPKEEKPSVEPGAAQVEAPEAGPLPEQYKGKSATELASILEEKERFISRQSNEIGDLRKDLSTYEQLQQRQDSAFRQVYPQQYPYPPQMPQEEPIQFNYTNPIETIDKITDRKLAQYEMAKRAVEGQRLISAAGRGHEEGKVSMKSNPNLFQGIENDVEQAVVEFYRPYVQSGYDVSQYLRDPKTWETAATVIRIQRGELDKIGRPSPKPMRPVATETPGTASAEEYEAEPMIELDEEGKKIMKAYGLTEKEAREVILEEAKKKGRY